MRGECEGRIHPIVPRPAETHGVPWRAEDLFGIVAACRHIRIPATQSTRLFVVYLHPIETNQYFGIKQGSQGSSLTQPAPSSWDNQHRIRLHVTGCYRFVKHPMYSVELSSDARFPTLSPDFPASRRLSSLQKLSPINNLASTSGDTNVDKVP